MPRLSSSLGTKIMLGFLIFFTLLIWALLAFFARSFPIILSIGALSYVLGLRHAIDLDHIAAIDTTTRKLHNESKNAASVGFFFSFGHSLVVILLSLLIAFFSSLTRSRISFLGKVGPAIGTSFSIFFLLSMGIINVFTLKEILAARGKNNEARENILSNGGVMVRFSKPLFAIVTQAWHMLLVGFLFGLGFDTATEIGLLGISALTAESGMPTFIIILFPLAFTAGMMLIDTLDGMAMLKAYNWANADSRQKNIYNVSITLALAFFALVIGGLEMAKLLNEHLHIALGVWNFH